MKGLYIGDVRDVLPTLESESVQMCVTSPPYWGLRDYGVDGQLGFEQTPEEYVANMVAVFREVRRVLRDDGTCWLNMGDGYAQNEIRNRNGDGNIPRPCREGVAQTGRKQSHGLKPKDLIGIPWRVAFALQADGWWLRQDIIWHKPNPMPESVKDRCTKGHEYLFLLSKSPRYYFDAEAIKEPETMKPQRRLTLRMDNPSSKIHGMPEYRKHEGGTGGGTRNKRSVWTVATQPYKGAHFATFPEKLVTPCILAGSRPSDVVLDPFMGSGTTALVATRLEREWLGVELNQEYASLIRHRLSDGHIDLGVLMGTLKPMVEVEAVGTDLVDNVDLDETEPEGLGRGLW